MPADSVHHVTLTDAPPEFDGAVLQMRFVVEVDGKPLICAITVEALEDHFGASSALEADLRDAFDRGRARIEAACEEVLADGKGGVELQAATSGCATRRRARQRAPGCSARGSRDSRGAGGARAASCPLGAPLHAVENFAAPPARPEVTHRAARRLLTGLLRPTYRHAPCMYPLLRRTIRTRAVAMPRRIASSRQWEETTC